MKTFKQYLEPENILIERYTTEEFKWILNENPDKTAVQYIFEKKYLPNFYKDENKWDQNYFYFVCWKGLQIVGIAKTQVDMSNIDDKFLKIFYIEVSNNEINTPLYALIVSKIFNFCRKKQIVIKQRLETTS